MDETTCMVRVLERISRFYYVGVLRAVHALPRGHRLDEPAAEALHRRRGRREELALLLDVANRIEGHTICAFGDAAAWPVQSFLKHYRHEFEYMIDHGGRSMVTEPLGARAA